MQPPKLNTIPIMNLRREFLLVQQLLTSGEFNNQMGRHGEPIETPLLTWNGFPNQLLTLLLQRTISGLESYVVGATWIEMNMRGKLTGELNTQIRNPFIIPGEKGAVAKYYHLLPALLESAFSLKRCELVLYEETGEFYKQVRNPLFHGQELETNDPSEILPYFTLIQKIYDWIAQWHEPEVTDLKPIYFIFQVGNSGAADQQ